ncbi:tRNA (guanine-N(1)-)-methyltransferase [Candidatus Westeberhardia cardiocondylae]|uniref:tRNA (guanine-N(1)-)-methyltransferase n=1 Tax=Candidatus Westeberhardia cardiocondylae TaxID=1594731 RepID=A0A0H5BWY9_9ENTR|nr:tRNA (guanosine(37)-N1)-methyltransferase TrmD [Candidatus Westeberhardia cardiocondylae]CEN32275.1 tRNA (guanine-N(1)-)-methyltransferase [Candidatus Westeberhardia cardiocondylae]
MWIGVITLFPDMFHAITDYGVVGRAVKNGFLKIHFWNPRDFTNDKHFITDDRIYGGGSGMLMLAKPLQEAIFAAKNIMGKNNIKVIYLSPQGRKLDHKGAMELSCNEKMILLCGRYKGIDERLILTEVNEEWSVGDYVLSGGELAAMTLIDVIARFIPGVLNNFCSLFEDSFSNGLLSFPCYTRPRYFNNIGVPLVLLSGNHVKIYRWRLKQSLIRTWKRRPEILKKMFLTEEQNLLLCQIKKKYCKNYV